jgi:hypothetical protein
MSNEAEKLNDDLRFKFVELLFALAIGEVGVQVGELVVKNIDLIRNPQIVSHLLLVTIIISSSWVGWKTSMATSNVKLIHSTIDKEYIILLLDLFIVVCYFIMVRSVVGYYIEKENEPGVICNTVTALNQTLWSMIIFGSYFVWDLVVRANWEKFRLKRFNIKDVFTEKSDFRKFALECIPSLVGLIISICIFAVMRKTTGILKITIVNFILIFLFLCFRCGEEIVKNITDERVDVTQGWRRLIFGLFGLCMILYYVL